MANPKTDPARFEVVKNALFAAAEEMKIVLAKTAYSPLLKVAGDYSRGIFDANGDMVAQGPDLPIHLGSMPEAVRAVVRAFPDVAVGDVFIHNDPYHGGSHLPDVNVVAPAFHGGRLLGFGCVRAHWPDIGSASPGSYGAVTEIYGEGLRLPPIRLYRDGKPDPSIEAIIFANVRTPAERLGDLRAQVAATWRGTQRMVELAAKYGTDELLQIMREVLDYSETMMRAALRALPDGPAVALLKPPVGPTRKLNSKGGFLVPAGSLVVLDAPGSGGFGDPAERDPAALSEDLLDGYVTSVAARRDYGVDAA